jgi:dihydroorotase
MSKSLLIKNARILVDDKLINKNILIIDGKIKQLTSETVTVDKVIDAKNNIVMPGMIDAHVHFREPGLTHKEDFLTGSRAAAKGGVTTIIDMPNTIPPTNTLGRLEEKRELAKKSVVNYGFNFAASVNNIDLLKKVKNVASVKVFFDISTGELMIDNDHTLKKIFQNSKIISVHAEGDNVLKAIELIKNTKNRLYLCHIALENELSIIKKNNIKNKVFVEVTPHHLFLTKEDDKDGFTKMKPSLKTKQDQEALWQALQKNKIHTIGSDHAPHTKEEKENGNPPFGVPGVETTLPLMLDAVNKERLTLSQVQRLCCENPAKIFRIQNKGLIKEGFDADLTIIDMNLENEVKNEEMFTKCKWSPFNGFKLKGWPIMTIVNGNIIYDNGNINDIKGKEIEYF